MLEPTYEVGGDVFDFALSEPTPCPLAIFDAVGHGLPAGLMAAPRSRATAAHVGTARSVYAQGRAIDDALAAALRRGRRSSPRILGELDVASGRLRYVNAGHPPPLLVRDGPGGARSSARAGDCPSAWRRRA